MKDGVFMQIVGSDAEWKAKFAQWWKKIDLWGPNKNKMKYENIS